MKKLNSAYFNELCYVLIISIFLKQSVAQKLNLNFKLAI